MSTTRRKFIKQLGGAAALVGAGEIPAYSNPRIVTIPDNKPSAISANDKIRIACIGMGIMGFKDVQTSLQIPGIELAGVCDLYDGHLTRSKELFGKNIFTTRNYKELLQRKDIDAVIIATSDHWHDRISIDAMNAGKHVYCEKPIVHQIEEGQGVIDAQKKTGKVFQVGSQRVSGVVHQEAKRLFESGAIGEINMVEAVLGRHNALGAWQYSIPTDASLKTVDWENFLGDAPKVAYDPIRFFRWRNYRDYGTGVAGDLYVHLLSGLHVVTGSLGPSRIFSSGSLSLWKDGRDVPDVMATIMDYPKTEKHAAFQMTIRVNFADGSGGGENTKIIGTEGMLEIGWNKVTLKNHKLSKAPGYGGWDSFETFPEAVQKEFEKQYNSKYSEADKTAEKVEDQIYIGPEGANDSFTHFANFYDSIRTGKPVVEDAVFSLRAAGPSLAANKSYFEQKVINWDPTLMRVV